MKPIWLGRTRAPARHRNHRATVPSVLKHLVARHDAQRRRLLAERDITCDTELRFERLRAAIISIRRSCWTVQRERNARAKFNGELPVRCTPAITKTLAWVGRGDSFA